MSSTPGSHSAGSLDLVKTLSDLVAIPSVNPMGRPDISAIGVEAGVTDYLEQTLHSLGLPTERQTVAEGRENILARLEGSPGLDAGGELIVWEVHQDTVPVDGMTIPPWTPNIEHGRLYGRGSCDVKGGMAAMLHALSRLTHAGAAPAGHARPTIVFAATVNEEYGFSGAKALARSWLGASRLLPRQPDAIIVAEPTNLDVVVAHKGAVRWRCQTLGRAVHSSQPEKGDNAIFRMARVLAALERYQRDFVPALASHPRCGHATLSVGLIQGGLSVNTVPDRCTIEIDRRLVPGEDPRAAYRATIDFIQAELAGGSGVAGSGAGGNEPLQIVHAEPFLSGPGLSDRQNISFGERLLAAVQPIREAARLVGVPYGTDAAVLSAGGAPCVVFGPGSIDQAHTVDEWISLDELSEASDALVRFAMQNAS